MHVQKENQMYKKMPLFALAAALAASLASCASFPEPEDDQSTLVIGKLDFSLEGTSMMSDYLSRITTESIAMVLENRKTGERYFLNTDLAGNFIKAGVPAGRYALSRIDVGLRDGETAFTISGTREMKSSLNIKAGTVSNMGLLDWRMVIDGMGMVTKQVLLSRAGFDEVLSNAKKRAPKSKWWNFPIEEVPLD